MKTALPTDFVRACGRFFAPLRAKCRRVFGATALAEEVAHESLVRLWQSGLWLETPMETPTIMAWLYVTSTLLTADALVAADRRAVRALAEAPLDASGPTASIVNARRAIVGLRNDAPGDELEAVILSRIDGLSDPDVAALLGISPRAVERLLARFDARGRTERATSHRERSSEDRRLACTAIPAPLFGPLREEAVG